MKLLALLLSLFVTSAAFAAEPPGKATPADPDAEIIAGKKPLPGLKLELLTPKKSYELGEPIEVTMRYTYTGDRKLTIEHVTYDRTGRVRAFGFTATDAKGRPVRDPIADHLGGMMGPGGNRVRFSADRAFEQKVFINEWLCFDEPGRYRITAHSWIVQLYIDGCVLAKSGPLILDLTPPVGTHRLARLEAARKALRAMTKEDWGAPDIPRPPDGPKKEQDWWAAVRDLRFMLDPRAVPLLLDAYEAGRASDAAFGLLSLRDMAPVRTEILKHIQAKPLLTREDIEHYARVLTAEHLRTRSLRHGEGEVSVRWTEVLMKRRQEQLVRIGGPEAEKEKLDRLVEQEPKSLEDWKDLLAKIPAMTQEQQEWAYRWFGGCQRRELIPGLLRLAADEKLPLWRLREVSLDALDGMGEPSHRDIVANDYMAPVIELHERFCSRLGDYRAAEIADRLLTLVERLSAEERQAAAREAAARKSRPEASEEIPPGAGEGTKEGVEARPDEIPPGPREVRATASSAAKRLARHPYATAAAPAERLRRAYLNAPNEETKSALLTSLARRSPEDAAELIPDLLQGSQKERDRRFTALDLLLEMDLPAAQAMLLKHLRAGTEDDRERQAPGLQGVPSPEALRPRRGEPTGVTTTLEEEEREGLARALPTAFFPEVLRLYRGDPSFRVRFAARENLVNASGISASPPGRGPSTEREAEGVIRKWETWWAENGARFPRWSEVRHGIALKCSTEKGVYEVCEPIWLTLRLRREAGDAAVAPAVRLMGESKPPGPRDLRPAQFGRKGTPLPLPQEQGKPILGAAPRTEATFRLDLQRTGNFLRPGSYALEARCPVKDKRGRLLDDPPQSPPLLLRVRYGPEGLAWSEPQDGLAMAVSCDRRRLGRHDGIALEARFKNTREEGALTIAWPVREPEFEDRIWFGRIEDWRYLPRDPVLRFLHYAVTDENGKPVGLGQEPERATRRQLPWQPGRPLPKYEPVPEVLQLLPGQVARLSATPDVEGSGLQHLSGPYRSSLGCDALRKGGKFGFSVTYQVPKDAPLPPAAWRGRLAANLGEITVEPPEPAPPEQKIDEKALGLDEIKLPPRPPDRAGGTP